MTVTLQDPQTGTLVHLAVAQLPQRCKHCGAQLQGALAASTEETGWVCVTHLERILMDLPLSQQFRDRSLAREQLAGASPGDTVTVTRPMLAAVGAVR